MSFVRRFVFGLLLLGAAFAARAQSTTPALTQVLPAQALLPNTAAVTLDLRNYFGLPGVTGPVAQVDTVLGKFNLELFANDTPLTVANFQAYINAGRYANSLVHRSVAGFVVQMGGYTAASPFPHVVTFPTVQNEFKRSNLRGTVAMAKLGGDPNSATSEWFVNLGDNSANLDSQNGGFTVFGRVLGSGMTVVDAIAAVPIYDASEGNPASPFGSIPLRNIQAGQQGVQPANLIIVNSVAVLPIYPAAAGGASVLSFAVANSNPAVATAAVSGSTLTITPVGNGVTAIAVTATDTNGTATVGSISVTIGGPVAPAITAQPQAQIRMVSGTVNTVVFTVNAMGTPAPAYQWKRNGAPVTGQRGPTYVLTNASDAQAGRFTCVVSNDIGSVESEAAVLSFVPAASPGRLINLSILTELASGENMTMGTVLGGVGTSGTKALLARAAGPALTQLGVTGVLPDPKMTLAGPAGSILGENNDWGSAADLINAFLQVGAFSYGSSTKDAAIFQPSLAPARYPAGYTVQVSDVSASAGMVIAELYDSTPTASYTLTTSRLINVSVNKVIPTGTTLTAGFVIDGTTAKTVLVRAMGPSLSPFGLTDFMVDPRLALFSGQSKISENDNWGGDAQLTSVGTNVGAFPPVSGGSKDAILVLTLAPGNYTAQVTGNGGGGRALVEVYEVP